MNQEGLLFPKEGITSGPSVARSPSDFYTLRGYRGNLYFDGDIVITSSDIAQVKSGNFYVLLANGSSGQRNLGVQFYKNNTLTRLYLMYKSSTNYSALYHTEYGSVISINEETGVMNFNGLAKSAQKLSTNRTISLTGNVTGSVSTNLSGNVSISTTVANAPASAITGTLPIAHGGTGGTSAAAARTNLQLFTEGANSCWGRFSSGTNFAVAATGNLWYQDCTLSSVISFPITFSSIPKIFFGVSSPTAEVVCIEPLSVTTTGISKVRIKRTTNTKTSISINWIAIGTT